MLKKKRFGGLPLALKATLLFSISFVQGAGVHYDPMLETLVRTYSSAACLCVQENGWEIALYTTVLFSAGPDFKSNSYDWTISA